MLCISWTLESECLVRSALAYVVMFEVLHFLVRVLVEWYTLKLSIIPANVQALQLRSWVLALVQGYEDQTYSAKLPWKSRAQSCDSFH